MKARKSGKLGVEVKEMEQKKEKKHRSAEVSWPVGPDATYEPPAAQPENLAGAWTKDPRYG